MKRLLVVLPILVLATACAPELGPGMPQCAHDEPSLTAAALLQFQSLPDARWGPCVETLRAGWEFGGQSYRNGHARFWLESDQLGGEFLRVDLSASCDAGGVPVPAPRLAMERFVIVERAPAPIEIVVVPETPDQGFYAGLIAERLEGAIVAGYPTAIVVADGPEPVSEKISSALERGAHVMAVGRLVLTEGIVELHSPGPEVRQGLSRSQALVALGHDLPTPVYRARWFDVFDGGCVEYRFEGKGEGALTVVEDTFQVLSYNDFAEFRRLADEAGYDM